MPKPKTIVMLVGPKGAGKTHVGEVLEKSLGIAFLRVDDIWVQLKKEQGAAYGTPENKAVGFRRMEKLIQETLERKDSICLESTGVGVQKQEFIKGLARFACVLLVKVVAPAEVCLERIRARDNSGHVALGEEAIRQVNEAARGLEMKWDLVLDNEPFLKDEEIVERVGKGMH